jgi:hypothetical protein
MAKKARELDIGDNLIVTLVGGDVRYYQITGVDNIYYRDTHAALAAAGTESYAEISNLDPPNGQLYFLDGIEIDGNVDVYLKQPAATNRLGTNKSPEGGILVSTTSGVGSPRPIAVWVARDYAPNVQLVNNTDVSITAILTWNGVRFSVKQLTSQPNVFTPVKIGGIAE